MGLKAQNAPQRLSLSKEIQNKTSKTTKYGKVEKLSEHKKTQPRFTSSGGSEEVQGFGLQGFGSLSKRSPQRPRLPERQEQLEDLVGQVKQGGNMAQWLGRRTLKPEVAGPSPALTTQLELFLGRPQFISSPTFVNRQLVCLLSVGILNHVNMFICIICFIICFHQP